ncbi:MAG: SpoIIE family protein phosphatase [Acidiferrobacteraceae bacterium]|jgi:serine phosphatase RsbU (regulator of sigma subunit)
MSDNPGFPPPRSLLRRSELFATADDEVLDLVAERLEKVTVVAGDSIVRKGEPGDAAYLVVSGKVRVHDGDLVLNFLQQGELFGELSALDDELRSASVTAQTDSTLLRLGRNSLYELFARYPDTATGVIQGLCRTLRHRVRDISSDRHQIDAFERELEIGRRIQGGFLPSELPQLQGWHIEADLRPAREVAGDFYDAFPVPDIGYTALLVGDVCDKGVGAALFMSLFRSLIRVLASEEETQTTASAALVRVVTRVNNYVATEHGRSSMFTTLFIALLKPETGELVYINAGHEPAFIMANGAPRARLEPTGPVVGLFAGASYGVESASLAPGEMLVVYTDGVTEARDDQHACFGEERLLEMLSRGVAGSGSVKKMIERIDVFVGDTAQSDDITILTATRD